MSSSGTRPINILLLNADPLWQTAVREAAYGIADTGLTEATSPADALRLLIETPDRFSHVVVQPSVAGPWLADLREITAGSVESKTELVLLGPNPSPSPTIAAVSTPTAQDVAAALLAHSATDRSGAPVPLPELYEALNEQAIEARYQPIVSLQDGSLFGVEVLARLKHPSRGTLPPDTFVPPMENAGLWDKLLGAITASGFRGLTRPGIADLNLIAAFNLPLQAVLLHRMMADLEVLREEAGIPAERVLIELTESHPVNDVPALAKALVFWRDAGYGVSIDDLSPQVANHRALLDLPFTVVKLDKSVVTRSRRQGDEARAYLSEAVRIARGNGMKIIAEGTETPDDWVRMRDLGIDLTQSYLVSRPLPASALPVWARLWGKTGASELTSLPPRPAEPA